MKLQTDEQLMRQVAYGELKLLSVLFERHHKHVYNFIFQMCSDKDLSEDIVQEVFFKILKHRATFGEGKFIAWMFTIARNSLSGHYKKEQRFTTTKETIIAEVVEDPECKEQYSDLHAALAKLTPTDREVVVLNRLQGVRYEELAIILNSTPNAVKTKVSRALDKLRKVYFKQVEV